MHSIRRRNNYPLFIKKYRYKMLLDHINSFRYLFSTHFVLKNFYTFTARTDDVLYT
jgi:hypothetical protein